MLTNVASVRALLPGVGAGEEIDEIITFGINQAEAEIISRLSAQVNFSVSPTPPIIKTLANYLSASIYLLQSMSAGQEDSEPRLSQTYRNLAEAIIKGILEGMPVIGADGEQVEGASAARPLRSYTLRSINTR